MLVEILIAGEWTLVKVVKVYRGRKTARVIAPTGERWDLPTCLLFGEEPGPGHPMLRRMGPQGGAA